MSHHIHPDNYQGLVAHLVSYTPALFLLVLAAGIVLHVHIPIVFVSKIAGLIVGIPLLIIGPALIYFAQRKRHTLYTPIYEQTCDNFDTGPYAFSRHPVYLGLFMLLFGFSFLINSLPMLLLTAALGPFFTYMIIPKEEELLEKMCGDIYRDYKKRVRIWL